MDLILFLYDTCKEFSVFFTIVILLVVKISLKIVIFVSFDPNQLFLIKLYRECV